MEESNRASLIALMPEMARRFPDHSIILRPHPSEIVEKWHAWIGGHDRVKVWNLNRLFPVRASLLMGSLLSKLP